MFDKCPTNTTPQGVQAQQQMKGEVCLAFLPEEYTKNPKVLANISSGRPNVSKAVFLRDLLWPQHSTLHIKFLDGCDWQHAWVEKLVMEQIEPLVNLKFKFVQRADLYHVTITFDTNIAQAVIGKTGVNHMPSMYLGWTDPPDSFTWKDKTYVPYKDGTNGVRVPGKKEGMYRNGELKTGATVIHEFLHVLGMLHEHQNPKANIDWNFEAIWNTYCGAPNNWDWNRIQTNFVTPLTMGTINSSEYDPDSIMIYPFPAQFIKNNDRPTRLNDKMSEMDKKWLGKMYPVNYSCVEGECVPNKNDGEYSSFEECDRICSSYKTVFPSRKNACVECGESVEVDYYCTDKDDNIIDRTLCRPKSPRTYQCPECGKEEQEEEEEKKKKDDEKEEEKSITDTLQEYVDERLQESIDERTTRTKPTDTDISTELEPTISISDDEQKNENKKEQENEQEDEEEKEQEEGWSVRWILLYIFVFIIFIGVVYLVYNMYQTSKKS